MADTISELGRTLSKCNPTSDYQARDLLARFFLQTTSPGLIPGQNLNKPIRDGLTACPQWQTCFQFVLKRSYIEKVKR